jgi:hypothetical protein
MPGTLRTSSTSFEIDIDDASSISGLRAGSARKLDALCRRLRLGQVEYDLSQRIEETR